ncbi:hypothetical protein HanXRQr2_Chr14g0638141 [Helianthus annuus]|uniref:Uncharacterized protein n=1 Tax=Helianthus annuus TaxID=4232 RepID=A0A9K3E9U8_HELAN|nr:hypothetical protein HanXRQr2_Chr14g0638141 [Helianthus annuus]KAJ0839884.1 hypothetical protein HanPSC8_Chr14g0612061 [Helianthus annuus]
MFISMGAPPSRSTLTLLWRPKYSIMCIWNMSRVHEVFSQDFIPESVTLSD